ncbi:MAG: ATP-binding protein [Myxococcota bacterium]
MRLGHQACRKGYRVISQRLPRLLDELAMSHGDGSFPRALAKLAGVNVLVLDDWGLKPLKINKKWRLLGGP